jgi:uncharacterized protein (DUF697 family)
MDREFRSQLGLRSYVELAIISNTSLGIIAMVIGIVQIATATNYEFRELIEVLLAPLGGFISGIVVGIITFPFYKFVCNRLKGHRIKGKFREENDV